MYYDANTTTQVSGDSFAVFSKDMSYRYRLVRVLRKPDFRRVIFIMLNPSTADAFKNDPTVARCCRYAKDWGFDSIEVLNLFAWRATSPLELYNPEIKPVGTDNNHIILESVSSPIVDKVVLAWGCHGAWMGRGDKVMEMLGPWWFRMHFLEKTKEGHPKHPLYLKANLTPVKYVG